MNIIKFLKSLEIEKTPNKLRILSQILSFITLLIIMMIAIIAEYYFFTSQPYYSITSSIVIFMFIIFVSSSSWLYYQRKKAKKESPESIIPRPIRTILTIITIFLLLILFLQTIYAGAMLIKLNIEDNSYQCISSSGFGCRDLEIIKHYKLKFAITNGLGYAVNMSNIETSFQNASCGRIQIYGPNNEAIDMFIEGQPIIIEDMTNLTIILDKCNFKDRKNIKGTVTIKYTNPKSGLPEIIWIEIFRGTVKF